MLSIQKELAAHNRPVQEEGTAIKNLTWDLVSKRQSLFPASGLNPLVSPPSSMALPCLSHGWHTPLLGSEYVAQTRAWPLLQEDSWYFTAEGGRATVCTPRAVGSTHCPMCCRLSPWALRSSSQRAPDGCAVTASQI